MSSLAGLKAATSIRDVARLLNYKPKALAYLLYRLTPQAKYRSFEIPKRAGGLRQIKAPIPALKLLQRRLSDLLQNCIDEINAARNRKDRVAHGFRRRRSIITNAQRHRHRRWVFNLDLEQFFPSINFGRVRGFFIKNQDFALSEKAATVIAQIACDENSLPQGSPCSPVISNLIAHLLDMRLVKLASEVGCTYSRYADDLTFSTNKRDFPAEIAVASSVQGSASHSWLPGKRLESAIERTGFRINASKTHQMYCTSRQRVTGLVVNRKINVCSEYRHTVRAMVHRFVSTGSFELLGLTQKDGILTIEKKPGSANELHGMLGFIDTIDVHNKRKEASSEADYKLSSSEKTYRAFLFYSLFYAAKVPIIICEGETDNVYRTHAIRSLAAEYPVLAEVVNNPVGKINLKVRLYKYPRTSTARLLELRDGGSGGLARFIHAYKTETGPFSGPGLTDPVIILYDNDDGASSIRNAIKSVTKSAVVPTARFVPILKNLYAVPTPLVAPAAQSKIEDFFADSLKRTLVEGKSFNPSKDLDKATQYGKKVFAHKVVRPAADRIDFSGFRPLLGNLAEAINKHRQSVIP